MKIQLLQFGLEPPTQPSKDGAVWFYLKRFALIDPVLALLSVFALPSLVWAVRAGKREAALLLSWIAVACGALLLFHYRNLPYLLYAIPPLCVAAPAYAIPRLTRYPKFCGDRIRSCVLLQGHERISCLGIAFCFHCVHPFGEMVPLVRETAAAE